MIRKIYFVLLYLLVLHSSCRTDYDWVAPDPPLAEKYRILCLFEPGKSIIANIGDVVDPEDSISEKINDRFLFSFFSDSLYYFRPSVSTNFSSQFLNSKWKESPTNEYKLFCSIDSNLILTSETKLPKEVKLDVKHSIKPVNVLQNKTKHSAEIHLEWNDPEPDVQNYYHLVFYKVRYTKNKISGMYEIDLSEILPPLDVFFSNSNERGQLILQHEPGVLVDDHFFRNGPIKLDYLLRTKNTIDLNEEKFIQIKAEIRSVSEDYYKYFRAITLQYQAQTGTLPILESVSSYSNIKGGLGIFAGYRSIAMDYKIQ
ncbi:MAG TPA: DUF4249 family protein [Saprospiraceae bacterium]|nr:DUF4249 family protein [Saprospiraceae bacterium]